MALTTPVLHNKQVKEESPIQSKLNSKIPITKPHWL